MKLTSDNVLEIFHKCLAGKDTSSAQNTKSVEGVAYNYVFDLDALKENESQIIELLYQLPDGFKTSGGGGWSFLNACVDNEGNQWGEQFDAELLMCLGIAIDRVGYCISREMWAIFPGGVPYFYINDSEEV